MAEWAGPRKRRLVLAVLSLAAVIVLAAAVLWRRRGNAEGGGERPPPAASASIEGARFSGCDAVTADGVCELAPEGELRIWIPAQAHPLAFFGDGSPLEPASRVEVEGGTLAVLHPGACHQVVVQASPRSSFAVDLAPARPKPTAVREATRLRAAGKLEEARARLESDRARAEQANELAPVLGLLARIALAQGKDDDVDRLFGESIRAFEAGGRASEAADDAFALAFSLLSRSRLVEARRIIAQAEALSRRYPDGGARARYYTGLLLGYSSRPREALREVRLAAAETARLGLVRLGRMTRRLEASILDDIGRPADALVLLEEQAASAGTDMPPCDLAELWGMQGIIATHVPNAAKSSAPDHLVRAIDMYETGCPASYEAARVANLESYLARAELRVGALDEASKHLRVATRALPHPRPRLQLETAFTAAELAVARGDPRAALAAWDEMADRARDMAADDLLRIALDGKARTLFDLGKDAGALAALKEAAILTDRLLVEVPVGEGRESYVQEQERDDARRVELLVRMGRPADAAKEVERIRSRLLDGLENAGRLDALSPEEAERWLEGVGAYRREREALEREAASDWKLSRATLDATRARRADRANAARVTLEAAMARVLPRGARQPADASRRADVTLSLVPASPAWLALVTVDGGTRAVRLGSVDPAAAPEVLSRAVLEPFRTELSAARRLAVVALGAARALDVHALPWDGAPLVAKMPVVYPIARGAVPADAATTGSLLVGDPTSDLSAARHEIDDVSASLRAAGASKVTVLSGAAATGTAVRAALGDARLFHYAGHGRFAGRDGWMSALPLAEHSELTVADILALARAPSDVVLLGCETARSGEGVQAEGLGLAQAFLMAGSRAVVASMRTVDDAAAGAMARAFYAHFRPGGDLAEALRAAQVDAWTQGIADYGAFRVLVR